MIRAELTSKNLRPCWPTRCCQNSTGTPTSDNPDGGDERKRQKRDKQSCRGDYVDHTAQCVIIAQIKAGSASSRVAKGKVTTPGVRLSASEILANLISRSAHRSVSFVKLRARQGRGVVGKPDFIDVDAMDRVFIHDGGEILDAADDFNSADASSKQRLARVQRGDHLNRAGVLVIRQLDRRRRKAIHADEQHPAQIRRGGIQADAFALPRRSPYGAPEPLFGR